MIFIFRPTNIKNGHLNFALGAKLRCPFLYDLSARLTHDTIKNGHKVPIFNVHGSRPTIYTTLYIQRKC